MRRASSPRSKQSDEERYSDWTNIPVLSYGIVGYFLYNLYPLISEMIYDYWPFRNSKYRVKNIFCPYCGQPCRLGLKATCHHAACGFCYLEVWERYQRRPLRCPQCNYQVEDLVPINKNEPVYEKPGPRLYGDLYRFVYHYNETCSRDYRIRWAAKTHYLRSAVYRVFWHPVSGALIAAACVAAYLSCEKDLVFDGGRKGYFDDFVVAVVVVGVVCRFWFR